jgi:hypothetical protein
MQTAVMKELQYTVVSLQYATNLSCPLYLQQPLEAALAPKKAKSPSILLAHQIVFVNSPKKWMAMRMSLLMAFLPLVI